MSVSSNALKCLPACKNQLCDNMIDKTFDESVDDTADEYESDNIGGDNAFKLKKNLYFFYTQSVLAEFLSLSD